MRCPACGYPNPEEAPTCFSCGGQIEAPKAGSERNANPQGETKKSIGGFWSRSTVSETWWIWLIAIGLIAVSFLLPWGSLLVYERTGPSEGALAYSTVISLSELIMSGDSAVTILIGIFLAGLLLCIIFPKIVILPMGALILMPFYMPDYTLTKLPPAYTSNQYYADPSLAVGYFFAWLALFVIGTLALSDFTLRFSKGRGKDQSPMERIEPNTYGWLWRYRRR